MCASEDAARLDRFLDDPREERPSRGDVDGPAPELKGHCETCGVPLQRESGPCRLGGPGECPVWAYEQRRAAA
jgi:hypothetical protein